MSLFGLIALIIVIALVFIFVKFIGSLLSSVTSGVIDNMKMNGIIPKYEATFSTFDEAVDAYMLSNPGITFTLVYKDNIPSRWFKSIDKHGIKTMKYRPNSSKYKPGSHCIYVEQSGYNVTSSVDFMNARGLHDVSYCEQIDHQLHSDIIAIGQTCTLLKVSSGISSKIAASSIKFENDRSLMPVDKLYKIKGSQNIFSVPDKCKSYINYIPTLGLLSLKTSPGHDISTYQECTSLLYN